MNSRQMHQREKAAAWLREMSGEAAGEVMRAFIPDLHLVRPEEAEVRVFWGSGYCVWGKPQVYRLNGVEVRGCYLERAHTFCLWGDETLLREHCIVINQIAALAAVGLPPLAALDTAGKAA